jgi:PAS domain-containing protein
VSGSARRILQPVPTVRDDQPGILFCGHCGHGPDPLEEMQGRVCGRCGLGLMLCARRDTAPTPKDPFLVVDGTLTICALSQAAEDLLGVEEIAAVNRHVSDFLLPADAEAAGPENLIELLIHAAREEGEPHHAVVRPAGEFGVRYWARVGACGPPRAALLVLADLGE